MREGKEKGSGQGNEGEEGKGKGSSFTLRKSMSFERADGGQVDLGVWCFSGVL